MHFAPPLHTPPRLPPGLIGAATRHAHALRQQALDDLSDRLVGLLRGLANRPGRRAIRETSCLS
ncbi:MAG: hypothetical protein JNM26_08105 [Ideonella sp.]|nr:hypothetical protein [Ideonella sp.]